jgi:MFS family permease
MAAAIDVRPRYRAARVLVVASIVIALCGSSAPSPLYSLYQDRWHFDSAVLTAVYAIYSFGTLLALALLGRVSDLLDDRRLILFGGLLAVTLGAVLIAAADSVPLLLVGRLFAGLGTGAVMGPATAALLELDPARDGTRSAVVATVAMTAGGTIGPIVTGIALETGAAPTVLPFLLLAVCAIAFLIGLRLVSWTPKDVAGAARRDRVQPALGTLIRQAGAPFLISCAGLALAWSIGGSYVGLGATFARRLVGITNPAVAGLTVAIFQTVAGCGQLYCRNRPAHKALVLGAALMSAGLVLGAFAAAVVSAALFGLATLVTGLGYGACFSGAAAIGNRSAPANGRATIVSLTYAAGYIGNMLPVMGLGVLADHFGLFTAMATLAGCTALASVAIARPGWRLGRR